MGDPQILAALLLCIPGQAGTALYLMVLSWFMAPVIALDKDLDELLLRRAQ